jgi:hypothetical protein
MVQHRPGLLPRRPEDQGALMRITIAVAVLAGLLSTQPVFAECQTGPEKLAYMRQCTSNCHFDLIGVCPDGRRDPEGFKECAAEVKTTFLACLENCLNRTNVKFGCPLQKLQ